MQCAHQHDVTALQMSSQIELPLNLPIHIWFNLVQWFNWFMSCNWKWGNWKHLYRANERRRALPILLCHYQPGRQFWRLYFENAVCDIWVIFNRYKNLFVIMLRNCACKNVHLLTLRAKFADLRLNKEDNGSVSVLLMCKWCIKRQYVPYIWLWLAFADVLTAT